MRVLILMHRVRIRAMRLLVGAASLLVVLGLTAPRALAFDFRGAEEIVVRAGDVVDDDLYVFGERVTIDGTVRGDVIFAGRALTVNGTIEGSLIAAGQSLTINGTVRDSARLAGQAALLGSTARIGRDVLFGGYSLELRAGSTVGRDAAIGGYQARLAGTVGRNTSAGIQALELSGTFGGNVEAQVGDGDAGPQPQFFMPLPEGLAIPSVAPGLTVSDTAQIAGRLAYTAREPFPIRGRVAGGTVFTRRPVEAPEPTTAGSVFVEIARRFVALAVIGLLLVWLAPVWVRRLGDTMRAQPLPAVGWGLVAAVAFLGTVILGFVGTIILAGIFGVATLSSLSALVIVLGLLGEAILVTAVIIYGSFVAQATVSYLGGRWLMERAQPNLADRRAASLLLGVAVFVVITAIPVVGGIIGLLAALLGLGAGWILAREGFRPAPAVPAVG